ncbi:uncharacterized protein LOC129289565 [Prosopis cineraria]|uniref:uncharacterized protein LOC129289565 n=1 Tax=Prosopis cineraria TaxID=364024 RepID=UPI00240F103C|nr:uncharacterized protein LOC129289565 [Prosopis cineraria]XP_054782325.1 uncharacterized protein LOC129289565 [Prosopis cineraria]
MAPFPFMDIWMGIEARRRLSQVLPDSMLEWWNQWELPGLVFISLLAQVLLTLLGNRRKYGTNKVNEWIVWCSYYLADKVPAFALGVISSKIGDFYNNKQDEGRGSDPEMTAFWVPFFLMHIGGPDSITAYSLEDNELWSRHLVGLVVRTTVTFYIIVLSWSRTSWISWLSLPMLGAGFVKYGERTWSLYSASLNHCRHSWLTVTEAEKARGEERLLHLKGFMSCFVSVFSDVVLDRDDVRELRNIFYNCSCEDFFSYMDFVHGFCYDMFFTKSIVTHTFWGIILRLITLITEAVAFICYAINFHTETWQLSRFRSHHHLHAIVDSCRIRNPFNCIGGHFF